VTLEQHEIEVMCAEPPVMINGDALRLEQVFQNLIANAIKYSPTGGLITMQVAQRDAYACVMVRDQGIGISAEAQRHLFELFYRAETTDTHRISGMGIGLYVVNELVTLHGGSVQVESREGAGSTFTVCLPLLGPE
jgi:signal transduction histidine kinase